MRYWLGVSLALNLFLLTTMVAARVDAAREPAQASQWRIQASQFGGLKDHSEPLAGIEDLSRALAAIGLANRDIKTLVVSWLRAHYADALSTEGPTYWESSYRPGLTRIQRQAEIEQQVRQSLLGFYGSAAETDPAFAAVFLPLGPEYDFLSSEEQLKMQARQLEALASRDSRSAPTESLARCQSVTAAANRTTPLLLPDGLGAAAITEYRLRFSSLAQQLRDSVDTDDEQYFRLLFDRLEMLEHTGSPQAQSSIRKELRIQMGDPAFDRFWSSRDPLFAPFRNYLRGQGIPQQQMFDAYAIVNRSQESLLDAVASQQSEESMLAEVQRIRSDESADLARLLGNEIAAGVAAATSRAAFSLSTASVSNC